MLAADTLHDVNGVPIFSDRQNIPTVADIDCNGHLDLFLGRVTGTVDRYEEAGFDSAGVPRFRLVVENFEGIRIIGALNVGMGSFHGANTMAFADYDDDGDLDLFWGDFFEQGLLLIENGGTCRAPNLRTAPVAVSRWATRS